MLLMTIKAKILVKRIWIQVKKFKYLVLQMLFGCWATQRDNQSAVQNNIIEPDFGVPGFVILKLCHL